MAHLLVCRGESPGIRCRLCGHWHGLDRLDPSDVGRTHPSLPDAAGHLGGGHLLRLCRLEMPFCQRALLGAPRSVPDRSLCRGLLHQPAQPPSSGNFGVGSERFSAHRTPFLGLRHRSVHPKFAESSLGDSTLGLLQAVRCHLRQPEPPRRVPAHAHAAGSFPRFLRSGGRRAANPRWICSPNDARRYCGNHVPGWLARSHCRHCRLLALATPPSPVSDPNGSSHGGALHRFGHLSCSVRKSPRPDRCADGLRQKGQRSLPCLDLETRCSNVVRSSLARSRPRAI